MWAERLRALFMRRDEDIGLLRTRGEVRARALRLPRWSIAQAPLGTHGVIHGRVRALAQTLEAPLSLQPCVAWRVHREGGALDPRVAQAQVEMEEAVEFAVDDDTGAAVVIPKLISLHLEWSMVRELAWVCDTGADLRERTRWIARHADERHLAERLLGASPQRYVEQRLSVGDPIALVCAVRHEADPSPMDTSSSGARSAGYRSAPTRTVLEAAPDAMFLYVTESP